MVVLSIELDDEMIGGQPSCHHSRGREHVVEGSYVAFEKLGDEEGVK